MLKTDAQIQIDVLEELRWEPSVQASNIGVEVKDGIVTLAGHVDTYAEKWHAEQAAQRVCCVKALAVEIDVKANGAVKRVDADIARSVQNILEWNVFVPKDSVKVLVENGWVTLSGQVIADYQRRTAASSIRYLSGVTGVSNQILLKPTVTVAAIKTDIEATLKRRASAEAKAIHVNVHNHEVTLSGKAQSMAERDLVSRAVWDSPGVWKVTDNILVSAV